MPTVPTDRGDNCKQTKGREMICNMPKLRSKLAADELCIGVSISFSDPAVSEALGPDVDFLWIDLEHNPMDMESLLSHLMAARASGAPAIVRIPTSDPAWIKRTLDSGAEGVILPQARSVDEVREYVSWCRYPPMGKRGFGPRRPSNYGRNCDQPYIEEANRELFVVAQIETVEALEQVEEIAAIEGLDSLVLGPMDLSGSMGRLGDIRHPEVEAAMRRVIKVARDAGKFIGVGLGANPEVGAWYAELGVQWLQLGCDFEYLRRFEQTADETRRLAGGD